MKSQKNSLAKVIAMVFAILCFGTIALTGCAKNSESADSVDVSQMYTDKNNELSIDWESIVSSLENCNLENSGFYIDKENLNEEAHEFYSVTFTNYDPSIDESFKDVDYQIMVSYGISTKNEFAYETPEFYDEPVYEIMVINNSSDDYYSAIFSESKKLLSEDGEWILDTDRDETISDYIDICSSAMNI